MTNRLHLKKTVEKWKYYDKIYLSNLKRKKHMKNYVTVELYTGNLILNQIKHKKTKKKWG